MITLTKRLPEQSDRRVAFPWERRITEEPKFYPPSNTTNDLDWTMAALVTFKCFLGVGGQLHSQAEADPRRAAGDQHHLCIHGPHCSAEEERSWRKEGRIFLVLSHLTTRPVTCKHLLSISHLQSSHYFHIPSSCIFILSVAGHGNLSCFRTNKSEIKASVTAEHHLLVPGLQAFDVWSINIKIWWHIIIRTFSVEHRF